MTNREIHLGRTAAGLVLDALDLVHEKLEESGMTQNDLAARLGVTKGRISQLLNGDGNMYLASLARLLGAMGYVVILDAKDVDEIVESEHTYTWQHTVSTISEDGHGVTTDVVTSSSKINPDHHLEPSSARPKSNISIRQLQ